MEIRITIKSKWINNHNNREALLRSAVKALMNADGVKEIEFNGFSETVDDPRHYFQERKRLEHVAAHEYHEHMLTQSLAKL